MPLLWNLGGKGNNYYLPYRNFYHPSHGGTGWDMLAVNMRQGSREHSQFGYPNMHLQRHNGNGSNVCIDCFTYLKTTGLIETRIPFAKNERNIEIPEKSVNHVSQKKRLTKERKRLLFKVKKYSQMNKHVLLKLMKKDANDDTKRIVLIKEYLADELMVLDMTNVTDPYISATKELKALSDMEYIEQYNPSFWNDYARGDINEAEFTSLYTEWLKDNVKNQCKGLDPMQSKVATKSVRVGQIYKVQRKGGTREHDETNDSLLEMTSQINALRTGKAVPRLNVYLQDALEQLEHETVMNENNSGEIPLDFDSDAYRIEQRYKDYMVIKYDDNTLSAKFDVKDGELLEEFPDEIENPNTQARVVDYSSKQVSTQWRRMKQSKFFITYVLHRPAVGDNENRHNEYVALQFARAFRRMTLDENLCPMVRFGRMIKEGETVLMDANKDDGENYKHSYTKDTWASHMHYVTADCGVEIAPYTRLFHFHAILSFTHWSKLSFDIYQMNSWLERAFKGLHADKQNNFFIKDVNGSQWYGDNDNPYVDLKLLPQDDWTKVLSKYLRKTHNANAIQQQTSNVRRQPEPRRTDTFVDTVLGFSDQETVLTDNMNLNSDSTHN